ncbi:MAG: nucleotidyltransferase family protein [Candidatus Brennerbacteria bacterium]|nr:nucleotidyltransferase family protein [Candidatus Brennerbacteria bacterium]
MKTFEEVKNILLQNKKNIEDGFSVKEIAIFGSYARNEQNEESDLDLLIDFKEPIGLLKFIELERHLSDLLDVKAELVTRRALKKRIGQRILQELIKI